MGYLLLGIENLAASLLCVALATALIARLRRRWLRTVLAVLVVAVPLLAYVCLLVLIYQIEFDADAVNMHWTLPLLFVTLACTAGAVVLVRRGLLIPRAAGARISYWVWGALAIVSVAMYMLLWLLFGTLDAGGLHQHYQFGWFWPFLILTLAFLVGAVLLVWRGMRERSTADDDLNLDVPLDAPVARGWSPGRLAIGFAATMMLHVMTFSNLDATAKRNLAVVRAEANAMALAVAPLRVPARENAATYYNQAIDAIGRGSLYDQRPSYHWPKIWNQAVEALPYDKPVEFDFSSAELGAFLKEHAGEIQLLLAGAAKPDCYFEQDYGSSNWDTSLQQVTDMRVASYLLLVHANWAAATGDFKSALTDLAAVRTMTRQLTTIPYPIVTMIAVHLDQFTFATLQSLLRTATIKPEDLAAFQFDDFNSYRRDLPRVLRSDEAMTLTTYADIDERIDLHYALALSNSTNRNPLLILFGLGPIYRVFLLVPDMGAYREFMQGVFNLSDSSYQRVQPQLKKLHAELARKGAGPLAKAATDMDIFEIAFRGDAINSVERCAFAMHRYRAAHGHFPEKLAELSPDIIPVVPRDPFTEGPLTLKKSDTGWVIYSVGPDLKDDGGKPLDREVIDNVLQGDIAFEYVEK